MLNDFNYLTSVFLFSATTAMGTKRNKKKKNKMFLIGYWIELAI